MKHHSTINYFDTDAAAKKYSAGRPYFHANTVEKMMSFLQVDSRFPRALDVACGTGLSTKALLRIADEVYGSDSSQPMLDNAAEKDLITYVCATADKQPFDNAFFDIITVSSGVHWFDIDSFLVEANRLLKSRAWLVLYDNFFMAEMEEDPGFNKWHRDVYLKKFPAPPRNNSYNWSAENLLPKHFAPKHEASFANTIVFTKNDLVNYFMSQSNTISAINSGDSDDKTIRGWFNTELKPYFPEPDQQRSFHFGNWILYLNTVKNAAHSQLL
jgi:ubiquinone/menaquinone biosynthesis C-methylase UbiE